MFDADGVRWIEDLGADALTLPGYNEGIFYFRQKSEAHSVVVLNRVDQITHAGIAGNLLRSKETPFGSFATVSTTPAYDFDRITSVVRGAALVPEDQSYLLLRDDITADVGLPALVLHWYAQTRATGATLEDGGKRITLERTVGAETKHLSAYLLEPVLSSGSFEFEPLPAAGPRELSRSDYNRIRFQTGIDESQTSRFFVVLFVPESTPLFGSGLGEVRRWYTEELSPTFQGPSDGWR